MSKRLLCNISAAAMILLLFHSAAYAYNLPDAGQTLCYDSGGSVIACTTPGYTGQDGAYDIYSMSYTDNNNNGTVTDNNTGLMWQKCSAGQYKLQRHSFYTQLVSGDRNISCNP